MIFFLSKSVFIDTNLNFCIECPKFKCPINKVYDAHKFDNFLSLNKIRFPSCLLIINRDKYNHWELCRMRHGSGNITRGGSRFLNGGANARGTIATERLLRMSTDKKVLLNCI